MLLEKHHSPNLILTILGIIILFICLIIIPLFFASYAEKESVNDTFFNFEEIFYAFKLVPLGIFKAVLITCLSLGFYIVSYLLFEKIPILVLICVFCYPLFMLCVVGLWAQVWKTFKEKYKLSKEKENSIENLTNASSVE